LYDAPIMKYPLPAHAVPAPPLRSFAALMELYEMNFMSCGA